MHFYVYQVRSYAETTAIVSTEYALITAIDWSS